MTQLNILGLKRLLGIITICISVGAMNAAADAQGEFAFWFSVQRLAQLGSGTIMLSGTVAELPVLVLLDANTAVHDATGKTFDPGAIRPGSILKVKAERRMEYFAARDVALNNPGEFVLTGILESSSAKQIRVANIDLTLEQFKLHNSSPAR